MLSSLFSGISGLLSNSLAINVIGNNIANVNTVGYKGSRATFGDFFYQSINDSSGTSQIGRGSTLSSIDTMFSQGSFETTTNATDLAIGGKGFFMVKVPGTDKVYYTRAGQFRIDEDGSLTTPGGYIVQGQSGAGVVTDVKIQRQASEAKATSEIGMYCNLNANEPWTGEITAPSAGAIAEVTASSGKCPRVGNYTAAITLRTADHSGSDLFNSAGGTLSISDGATTTTITLSGGDITAAVTAINTALQAAGVNVHAIDDSGALQLQAWDWGTSAAATGLDITVDDSGITAGDLGWTSEDKASTDLFGANLNLTGGPAPYVSPISVIAGTATNWADTGFNIEHNNITGPTSQTFAVSGFDKDNPTETSNWPSAITVYDSLGNAHSVTVYFRKSYVDDSGASTQTVWEWFAVGAAKDMASGLSVIGGQGELRFDANGKLVSGGTPTTPISFDFAGANPGQKVSISFVNGPGSINTTQLPMSSTTNYQSQDGYPPGLLTSVAVSTEGVLTGYYSNGQELDLYTIVLADFNNPMALQKEGNNLYSKTEESGDAFVNLPGTGGLGSISPNSLEQSNVDIATEFVKMIVSQRGFQANSRVITTTDEILQEILNLKR